MFGGAPPFAQAPVSGAVAPAQSPLLRIRAGIEAGNSAEVFNGLTEANSKNVEMAPNVRDMIMQWLNVNAPHLAKQVTGSASAPAPAPASSVPTLSGAMSQQPLARPAPAPMAEPAKDEDTEGVRAGGGAQNWQTAERLDTRPEPTADLLRTCLMKFFQGAPKGSDEALGLGIEERDNGDRFLSISVVARACGVVADTDSQKADVVRDVLFKAPQGVFSLSGAGDSMGVCLLEWAGWEGFSSCLKAVAASTRDPAFEPRKIQTLLSIAAKGAVKAGPMRQADVLKEMSEGLSPDMSRDESAPALQSAISRRRRLALACLVDAVAAKGLGPEAGPDSMGLVGQLPRSIFGLIFEKIDDRDRGACQFLGEILQSWDKRRCFSKRWLQDAASKFSLPRAPNPEKEEGKGWYSLSAENLFNTTPSGDQYTVKSILGSTETKKRAAPAQAAAVPVEKAKAALPVERIESRSRSRSPKKQEAAKAVVADDKKKQTKRIQHDDDDDAEVARRLEESRKRRAALMAKYTDED